MNEQAKLIIGTRGSQLALWQARETKRLLHQAHPELTDDMVQLKVITTTGDRIQDRALAAAGGKGLFTKEIEESLADGSIHMAVHSMKDMPTTLPDGMVMSCILEREDPRDAFISNVAGRIADLTPGATVGTASLRRQAQLLHARPDLNVVTYRGNVQTRLKKLDEGVVDATFLANAGLIRLGLGDRITSLIDTDEMLPAVAQGAIGVETRADDEETISYLRPLNHLRTEQAIGAERAMLAALDGSCRTPIAGLAEIDDAGHMTFRAEITMPDGSKRHVTDRAGRAEDFHALGLDAGEELKRRAGPEFLAAI